MKKISNLLMLIVIELLSVLIALQAVNPAFAQESDASKKASNIELFPLPGFEPLPDHKSPRPDTGNFKPQNFSFPVINRKDLTTRIEQGVQLGDAVCTPSWGLFAFRVNSEGRIDSIYYQGNLQNNVSAQIHRSIRATDNLWIVKKGTTSSQKAWFVYFIADIRARFEKRLQCSDDEKELLRAVSALANLYFITYYQVHRDYNRATIIEPTIVDGIIEPR